MSAIIGVVLGTLVALLLYLTENRLFTPNHALNVIVGFIVNAIRSLPFLILMVVLIPVVQLILGDPYTPTGGAISLSIAAVFARIAESAFSEVDPGLLEAAISTGATTRQIIVDAVFPQALPSFIRGVVLTIISLIGYSAMVGTIGAGGIGDMAIQYGYNRACCDCYYSDRHCADHSVGWRLVRAQGDALMVAYMRECAHIQSRDDREG